ncbi:MAG TPA: peptidylprolyl isomerase [Tenuifilaceae bacterium]|nr:peptidylprolyl isomerase [Tenuifilaceae bacterium]HPA68294.1 peptidylprolyl isomerase [Tenuifilaceae bacterium]HPH01161.1 peptidylprolyl isomerase [Tenuifilaceae bacterium]HQM06099.1 peptidylprolyl isomerase [Tenuifilaceae bacterium]HQQ30519.1 peptidylprolyl isomerase [Tenuifilaceae bacterium]
MATLEKIRNRAGVLVAVVIGLALLAFILGDLLSSGGSLFNRAQMEVAKIGGTSIPFEMLQAKIDESENLQKMFSNQLSLDEQTVLRIREQVWQDLVRTYTMEDQYKKLGLSIHPDELFDMVQGRNIHPIIQQQFSDPNTGQLNKEFITMFLKNMDQDPRSKTYWLFLEQEIQKDRLFNKYFNLITKGLYVTSVQAQRALEDRTKKVNFDYTLVAYSSIPDSSISVEGKEIKNYYKSHLSEYKQTASRDIEYVVFPIQPSESDRQAAEEWINKMKDEFLLADDPNQYVTLNSDSPLDSKYYKESELTDEMGKWAFSAKVGESYGPTFDGNSYKIIRLVNVKMLPDSVKARHILISPKAQNQEAVAKAKATADSLLNVIKRGGSWDDLASRFSDDPGSKDKGGDLGWFPGGVMVKNFDEAAFNLPKNEVKVVETNYGFHILQVTDRGKESRKVQLATLERKVVPSSTTSQRIYSEASQFASSNRTYEQFKTAADAKKLTRRVASNLLANDQNIAGLESPREVIRWAFKAEEGDVSNVFELANMYVVASLTAARSEGVAPLKQVVADVRTKVIRDKKAEKLAARVSDALKGASDIFSVAGKLNGKVEHAENVTFSSFTLPYAGFEPAVIGVASVSSEGKLQGPVNGNAGVYVLAVTSIVTDQGDAGMEKLRLANTYQSRAYYEAFEALKSKIGIVDKRYNFY